MDEVEEVTAEVVIVNVALEAAAGITTLAGTCAAAVLELVSVTVAPPLSAGPLNVTVPCEVLPPNTLVGFNDTDSTVGVPWAIVSKAVGFVPPKLAEMVEVVEEETAEVVIVNVALLPAAGTTTLAGTCAAAVLLLVKVTVAPHHSALARLASPSPANSCRLQQPSDSASVTPPISHSWSLHLPSRWAPSQHTGDSAHS